jgi:hypothetical protein
MKPKKKMVTVVHNAPGKKGKQEYRTFKTEKEALDYIDRNLNEGIRKKGRIARTTAK